MCEMSGVRSTEEATEEADEEEPGVSEQKQKPHTKMWGKKEQHVQKFRPPVKKV